MCEAQSAFCKFLVQVTEPRSSHMLGKSSTIQRPLVSNPDKLRSRGEGHGGTHLWPQHSGVWGQPGLHREFQTSQGDIVKPYLKQAHPERQKGEVVEMQEKSPVSWACARETAGTTQPLSLPQLHIHHTQPSSQQGSNHLIFETLTQRISPISRLVYWTLNSRPAGCRSKHFLPSLVTWSWQGKETNWPRHPNWPLAYTEMPAPPTLKIKNPFV